MTIPAFDHVIKEGISLNTKLVDYAMKSAGNFPLANGLNDTASKRCAIARGFLIATSQLTDQIMDMVSRDGLQLAIIGLRTLLEFNVNAFYIFAHPNHQKEQNWVDDLCLDIFDRTNNPQSNKSKLGDVPIQTRFEELGCIDLYKQNYAGLSDYSHLMLRLALLSNPQEKEEKSINIICHALCHLISTIETIHKYFGVRFDSQLLDEVVKFRDKHESK